VRTRIALIALLTLAVAACGSSSTQTTTKTQTVVLTPKAPTAAGTTSTGPTTSAAAPTCSTFCRNSGPSGGPKCPTSSTCAPCPANGCIAVPDQTAAVSGGVAEVRVQCLIPKPCSGAFVLLPQGWQTNGPSLPQSKWVAGSDFQVPAGSAATIRVGMTPLGMRLVSATNGYRAEIQVLLKGYSDLGYVITNHSPTASIRLVTR
jgi:hypothetical protein